MARAFPLHVDDPRAVGERLQALREAQGLSQRDVSFPGCSDAYVSRVEHGGRVPSIQVLEGLALRLGTSADYLAWGSGPRLVIHVALEASEVDRGIRAWTRDRGGELGLADLDELERESLERTLARVAVRAAGPAALGIRAGRA